MDGAITAGFRPDGDRPNHHRRFETRRCCPIWKQKNRLHCCCYCCCSPRRVVAARRSPCCCSRRRSTALAASAAAALAASSPPLLQPAPAEKGKARAAAASPYLQGKRGEVRLGAVVRRGGEGHRTSQRSIRTAPRRISPLPPPPHLPLPPPPRSPLPPPPPRSPRACRSCRRCGSVG